MTREEIASEIIKAIKKITMKEDLVIRPDSDLRQEVGLDSLDTVELLMDLEDNHGVVISNEEAEHLTDLNSVVDMVEKKLNKE